MIVIDKLLFSSKQTNRKTEFCQNFMAADVFLSPRNVFVKTFVSFRRTVTYGNRGFVTHFNKVNVFVIDFK